PNIADLLTDMSGIQSGSGSSTVRNFALPGDYRSRLDNAVLLVSGGSSTELETVNDISRNQTLTIDSGPVAGSVTLSWNAPTQNEDGTALTNLAGYKIYWGTTSGSYPNSVTINDKDATSYVVNNLSSGTYEFVATSFNTSGVESRYSAPATKVVP
ncbi:MAG: fibronectin type III domain-containing protein, partial [Gammaproteobacteria bacterium]|nr:fibronectin type III domain-containing protein [Gammaproteobacteria bacterium]